MTHTPQIIEDSNGNVVRCFIDGEEWVRKSLRTSGLLDTVISNKKKILGFVGSGALLGYMVLQQVPELAIKWPLTVKVFTAICTVCTVSGMAGAHASNPDVPVQSVAPLITDVGERKAL